jgi:hydrogenase maturation protease
MLLKPLLVLCLGNEILSDDRFGYEIAQHLLAEVGEDSSVEIVFAPVAGFFLLDLLAGRRKALIVDTIRTGKAPAGALHDFPSGVMTPSYHLTTSHQISLPTALELGRQMKIELPDTIDILAAEAQDLETISETMTPPVNAAIDPALQRIREWILRQSE